MKKAFKHLLVRWLQMCGFGLESVNIIIIQQIISSPEIFSLPSWNIFKPLTPNHPLCRYIEVSESLCR